MKAYFVHIPKTAGNSVRELLREAELLSNPGYDKKEREHHFGVASAKRVLNSHASFTSESFPSYADVPEYQSADLSFTVVRNPFDLLVSYYTHFVDNSKTKNWIDNGWANVNGHHGFKSFAEFIEFYCNEDPEKWHVPELSKNLFGQIFDDKKIPRVYCALYMENLDDSLLELMSILTGVDMDEFLSLREIGVVLNVPKINVSKNRKGKNYQDFYDKHLIELVEKKCRWELETFGYAFNKETSKTIVKLSEIL